MITTTVRTSRKLILVLMASAMASCAQETSGQCPTAVLVRNPFGSSASSKSSSNLFRELTQSQLLGGYLDLGSSRCTATFEFRDHSPQYFEVAAWTARHCSSEKLGTKPQALIQLYLGDGYSSIEVIDDLAARRAQVERLSREIPLSKEAAAAFAAAFEFGLGNQKNKEDTGCYNPTQAHLDRRNGNQVVCANTEDLGQYRLFVTKAKLSNFQLSAIKSSISSVASSRSRFARLTSGVDLAKWSQAAANVWKTQHLKQYAGVLEWVHNRCTGATPAVTSGPNLGHCGNLDAILDAANRYLVEDQKGIVTLATEMGFWDPKTKTLKSVNGRTLSEAFKEQEGDLRNEIAQNWNQFGSDLLKNPDTLWMTINITESKDPADLPKSYVPLPVQSLFGPSAALERAAQPNGIQLSEKRELANVQFDFTDSGAAITAYGVFPILALSGRCNAQGCEQTSGGVAVTPLPEATGKTPVRPSPLTSDQSYDSGRSVDNGSRGDCP